MAAPKPGVIPLRPLRVGEIFGAGVTTARTYWRTVLSFVIPVAVVLQLATAIVSWSTSDDMNRFYDRVEKLSKSAQPSSSELIDAFRDAVPALLLSLGLVQLLAFLGMVIVTAVITLVVSRAVTGAPMTPRQAFAEVRPRLLGLAGLSLLVVLIPTAVVVAGAAPILLYGGFGILTVLVASGFAIHLAIRLCLAGPTLMLEKQGILRSMSRSMRLVKGSWWRIFGIQVLVGIVTVLITWIIAQPFSILANVLFDSTGGSTASELSYYAVNGLGGLIGMVLVFPFGASVTALLYVDQRIRREGLDIELARAADLSAQR